MAARQEIGPPRNWSGRPTVAAALLRTGMSAFLLTCLALPAFARESPQEAVGRLVNNIRTLQVHVSIQPKKDTEDLRGVSLLNASIFKVESETGLYWSNGNPVVMGLRISDPNPWR